MFDRAKIFFRRFLRPARLKNVDIFELARGGMLRESVFFRFSTIRNTPPPLGGWLVVVVVVAGWLVGWLAGMGMVIGFDLLRSN